MQHRSSRGFRSFTAMCQLAHQVRFISHYNMDSCADFFHDVPTRRRGMSRLAYPWMLYILILDAASLGFEGSLTPRLSGSGAQSLTVAADVRNIAKRRPTIVAGLGTVGRRFDNSRLPCP